MFVEIVASDGTREPLHTLEAFCAAFGEQAPRLLVDLRCFDRETIARAEEIVRSTAASATDEA